MLGDEERIPSICNASMVLEGNVLDESTGDETEPVRLWFTEDGIRGEGPELERWEVAAMRGAAGVEVTSDRELVR